MTQVRLRLAGRIAGFILAAASLWFLFPKAVYPEGQSSCEVSPPGEYISWVARNIGHSGDVNPGNAHSDIPPFVPFINGCNPKAK
jgi:hypothetical protein